MFILMKIFGRACSESLGSNTPLSPNDCQLGRRTGCVKVSDRDEKLVNPSQRPL